MHWDVWEMHPYGKSLLPDMVFKWAGDCIILWFLGGSSCATYKYLGCSLDYLGEYTTRGILDFRLGNGERVLWEVYEIVLDAYFDWQGV